MINNRGWSITGDNISEDCAFNYIYGNVHYDENNDGCSDDDMSAEGFLINANDETYDIGSFSLSDGHYNLNLLEGNYTIELINLPEYFTVTPETTTFNFTGSGSQEQVDFCITANQAIEDLNITLLPISEARPGFEANYQLVVNNLGTQTVTDAEVNLTFDDEMQSFISASQNLSSSTDSELNFELTDLPPFGTQTIDLTMQTFEPPTVNGGDELNFITTVTPEENEYTPEDNAFNFEQEVVNAFDPNDKQVLQGEEIFLEEVDEYLVYIIRFQNTGSASAINVRLEDDLDAKLDWSTIQMLSSSDGYRVEITDGNHVEFFFDDINLPYEGEDEPGSHGFVAYKIKPKANVEVGDVISGNASIYFDYNEPIITNTVSTEIIEPLEVKKYDLKDSVSLYPNPAQSVLNIKTVSSVEVEQVDIFNIQGQEILSIKKNLKSINLENLSEGMYILQVKTNQGNLNQQLIKE
ncbi:T9SS type A sorting domain-containing protein [Mesonia aquimarina]|uniref:T9SS type A sorting domain-containing protein n=1 Tax=Mesonia aquimarina TaxID=1504967 RepID=UPI000EF57808|nr:T9SS type A sorting domain-containing protein [Mesonia aquimarina]